MAPFPLQPSALRSSGAIDFVLLLADVLS